MLEAIKYEDMIKDIRQRELVEDKIGILITRPGLDTGNHIINNLPYFHHSSSHGINFYLPGYGAYWYGEYPDEENVVKIDNVQWSFSNSMQAAFIKKLQTVSKWKYSGESELLIIPYHNNNLDFSQVLNFRLDDMLRDSVINSISQFFTSLFNKINEVKDNSVKRTRNSFGAKIIADVVKNEILKALPEFIQKTYNDGKYFVLKNYSKKD